MASVELSPAAATLLTTAAHDHRPKVLILIGPDGSGRNTIIDCLESLGIGVRCRQHTTRPPRHAHDEEHYAHVSMEEFSGGMSRRQYLMTHRVGQYWFGERLIDVQHAWAAGKIALFKGPSRCIGSTKGQIFAVQPAALVEAVLILTNPQDAWTIALQNFGVPDLTDRIAEGKRELNDALHNYRHAVDHRIVNRAGEFTRTVEMVMKIITAPRV